MKAISRIAGFWGLLALVMAALSAGVASSPYALTEAGIGVLLIVVFLVTSRGQATSAVKETATQRSAFFWTTSALIAVAAFALLVGVNFITAKRAKTIDLTNKKIYSLAPQTVQALKGLKEPVKGYGFMATDHPLYDTTKALFDRFASESDKFTYEFKDPKKSIELNAKYQIKEDQTSVIIVKGQGAAETHTALQAVSEQELTNALLKLGTSGTQKVYFLSGHAEWPITAPPEGLTPGGNAPSVSELKHSLEQEGYAVEPLDLAAQQNQIPSDAAVLTIVHASTPYASGEIAALEKYLAEGGRLVYFADWDCESGLEPLLAKYGVQIEKGVVADALNPRNPFQAVGFASDHEIAQVLKQLEAHPLIDTSRGLTPVKEGTVNGVVTTPVLLSSPKSWVETTPENPDPSENERLGAIPLIIASTADTKGAEKKRFDEARVLVFGDSQLVNDASWGNEVMRNLVMNGFGWTSTQFQKITIRPPDRDISTINIDDAMMEKIRFLSMIALPQLMIAMGIMIRAMRRAA